MVKNPSANAGDPGSISGLGRSSGEGNGNPFQHSCLENPMDRGAWRAAVHGGHTESDTTGRLSIGGGDAGTRVPSLTFLVVIFTTRVMV